MINSALGISCKMPGEHIRRLQITHNWVLTKNIALEREKRGWIAVRVKKHMN